MKIGLFTDTYRPSINGIVYVVESTKKHLEALGHEVYIFCPARGISPTKRAIEFEEDDHIIRFPSVKGAFYDDYDTSLFFPPRVLKRIRELDLDVIHFVSPGQVGLMGVYAAFKTNTPLIAQHCTDLREYVEHYRDGLLLPGLLALITLLPFAVKVDGKDIREIMSLYRPRRGRVEWNIDIVERIVTLVYSKCDAVIALSRKSKNQLESWQRTDNYEYKVTLKPDGVTPLPESTEAEREEFREKYGIAPDDELITFVGRLGSEKNLAMLIPVIEQVHAVHPRTRLLFVGDFEYRETLEALAGESLAPDRVTFTGALPRTELGKIYDTSSVFAFPSLTDTQAWVLHEATGAGLPVVMIDTELSEVVFDDENGYIVPNDVSEFAGAINRILGDDKLRKKFSKKSMELASQFTPEGQVEKLVKIYDTAIARHQSKQFNDK